MSDTTQNAGLQVPIDLIYLNLLAFESADKNIDALREKLNAAKTIEEMPTEADLMEAAACGDMYLQAGQKPYACTLSHHAHPIHVAHIRQDSEPVFAWINGS